MEICSRLQHIQDREINSNSNPNLNPSSSSSPMNSPSPRSNASNNNYNNNNCMSSSNSNSIQIPNSPHTPKTIPRSDSNNPYPTTFVQADTTTFKHVVQMLTGSSTETTATKPPPPQDPFPVPPPSSSSRNFNIPPIKTAPIKKQGFKLYERRNSLKNNLILNTMMPNFSSSAAAFSPRKAPEILSPSLLDFPSLTLSPVTPLNDDPFDKSPSLGNSSSEEDKAIAEKGFYLHPSPISTPRDSEPQLLPLFPLSSPRVSGSATTT